MNMSLCAIKFSLYCQNCLVINTSWVDRNVECAVIRGLGLGQGIPKTDELAIALFPATCSYLISENEKKKNSNRILVGFLGLLCCIHSDTQRPFFTLKQKRQTMTAKNLWRNQFQIATSCFCKKIFMILTMKTESKYQKIQLLKFRSHDSLASRISILYLALFYNYLERKKQAFSSCKIGTVVTRWPLNLFILTNKKRKKPVCPISHLVFAYRKQTLYLAFKSVG